MACLCGGESRRWTGGELIERFKNLGVCASRANVTAALIRHRACHCSCVPNRIEPIGHIWRHLKKGI